MFDRLIDLIVTWIKLLFFGFTLQSYQRGVVLRFGKFHRFVGSGFHFKWPLDIEECHYVNVTVETMMVGPQSLTTKDDKSIVVSAVVTFRVNEIESEVKKYLLEIEGAQQVIEDTVYGSVASFVMDHTWDQLRSVTPVPSGDKEKLLDSDNEITKVVRRLAKQYGVEIMNVKLADCTRSRSIRLMQQLSHHSAPPAA